MAGSVRSVRGRNDTWQLRVFVGRDSEGRVRHLHKTFRGTKRAAERELARLIAEQDRAPVAIPEEPARWGPTTTVHYALEAWKETGWDDLSPKTTRAETARQAQLERCGGARHDLSLAPGAARAIVPIGASGVLLLGPGGSGRALRAACPRDADVDRRRLELGVTERRDWNCDSARSGEYLDGCTEIQPGTGEDDLLLKLP
jgi:hypothetical protein